MKVLVLAFVIGVLNGLRSFTPPAAVAWAAHLRWINLQGALALIGSVPVIAIFTLLAAFELVADKMPWIPDRITTMSLVARGVMGALTAAPAVWLGGVGAKKIFCNTEYPFRVGSPISPLYFIQIFAGNVILGPLMRPDLALIGLGGFYSTNHPRLEWIAFL
jgi:hypothetical protein